MNWEKILLSPDTHILDAIRIVDEAGLQIGLVVDDQRNLLGTVTDGDIRRGILRKLDLSESVSLIMNNAPQTVRKGAIKEDIMELMKRFQLHHIPIIDDAGRVIELETLDHLLNANKQKSNGVVLMAGGLGERMRPLTESIPKPLIHVGKKPILETILENFIEQQFCKFYFSVNYKSKMIMDHFGDGSQWGVEIEYLQEDKKLGTAGSLSLLNKDMNDPLIVMNGDLLTRVNFDSMLQYHRDHKSMATMAIRDYDFQVPFGVVNIDGSRITGIDEKPTHKFFVNAGIYVLEPEILDFLSPGAFKNMPDLFQDLINSKHNANVFPIHEYWLDIGRFDDLDRAMYDIDNNY